MNFGTVGTSWITSSFIEASKGTLNLKGVYSRSVEKAKQLADTYQTPHIFTDLEQMAKSGDIDVVYIASPNALHYQQAKIFLQNGKHVICEKPIFSNKEELKAAYKCAEENGVYLFEAIRNVHTPAFKSLKENLSRAGKVRSAVFHSIQYSSRYDLFLEGAEPNVFSAAFSGGALVDLGVYPISLAVSLFGEPQTVSYHPVILSSGIDGSGTLILEYEGFICTILCSKIANSFVPSEIHGEKGSFIIEKASDMTQVEFVDRHIKDREPIASVQSENDMVYEIEDIVRIIETKNQEEYEATKSLSRLVLNITDAARKQSGIVFEVEK